VSRWGALLGVVAVASGCDAEPLNFDDPDSGTLYAEVALDGQAALADATLSLDATPSPEAMPFPEIGFDADRFFHPNRGDASRGGGTDAGADGDNQGILLGQCRDESDCAHLGPGLHCSLADASPGVCVACVRDTDCLDSVLRICDLTLNRCVQCDVASDCKASEVCLADGTHNTCILSCTNMQGCPPGASICDVDRKICLSCQNDDDCTFSPDGPICDLVSGRCGECAVPTDCHRKPYLKCDQTTSRCVECLRNSDCGHGVCDILQSCVGSGPPTVGKGDE
jgi:hypothetical protein